jgi:hypothetical protein
VSEGESRDTVAGVCQVSTMCEIRSTVSDSAMGERSLGRLSSEQCNYVFRVERMRVFLLGDLVFYGFHEKKKEKKKGKCVNLRT